MSSPHTGSALDPTLHCSCVSRQPREADIALYFTDMLFSYDTPTVGWSVVEDTITPILTKGSFILNESFMHERSFNLQLSITNYKQ